MPKPATRDKVVCDHCGEECIGSALTFNEKNFCCDGCKMVYQIVNKVGLCDYYTLNATPGINQRVKVRPDKFAFLDDTSIALRLLNYQDEKQSTVSFYLPQIHCSSCLYLLENLHTVHKAVISSRINFARKEATIVFQHDQLSLRGLAELLASLGYEPYISLNDLKKEKPRTNRTLLYQLGVAGFCFANIMLLSFPEYLGLAESEKSMQVTFRTINFILALPVFFYCSLPFFDAGWKGLRSRFLNIDAPIALAILVTFVRSASEVLTGTGGGYFDSMAGIVFFMLAGRVLQNKTYDQLSFDRDFSSYFPVAVSVLRDGREVPTALPDIKTGDTLLIHNEELLPADGIITRGTGFIDYGFVTGESLPVRKEMGELVYAGGKQTGTSMEILVIKEVAQSYLTNLWSRKEFKKESSKEGVSFVHLLSRYFTYIVLAVAFAAGIYWWFVEPAVAWNAVTAVLIVACPCALLLSNTFANGNILRILGRNKFYLRNAQTIENIANADHIVFDKTGTLTTASGQEVIYRGELLTGSTGRYVAMLAAESNHPLSKAIKKFLQEQFCPLQDFPELPYH